MNEYSRKKLAYRFDRDEVGCVVKVDLDTIQVDVVDYLVDLKVTAVSY